MVIKPSACHSSSFELRVSLIRNPSSETARLNYQLLPILECLAGALPFLIESAGKTRALSALSKKTALLSLFFLTVAYDVLYSMDPLEFTPLWGGVANLPSRRFL